MSINVEALRKRLGEITNKNKKSNMLWKPANGRQVVRIVPYAKNPENPFVELKFHYNLGGRTYLSPITEGKDDPVVEFANKVKGSGDQDDYKLAMGLFPKLRVYVPVVVRGEEDQGVRFWGFGKQVYQALLGIVADEDYGDITSLRDGNDITVEYKPKEETGKSFPETVILPRPKKTPVGDDKVIDAIRNQPNIDDIFDMPSYEDLEEALKKYLEPEAEDVDDSDDPIVGSSPKVDSAVEEQAAPKPASKNDFDKLFG